MPLQPTGMSTHLFTYITDKRLVTSAAPLVSLQVTCPGKQLSANITNKRSVTSDSVSRLMFLQVTSLDKRLAANITRKGFVVRVDPLVCF